MAACAAGCGGAPEALGMGIACGLADAADCGPPATLGIGMACGLADAAGGVDWGVDRCSAMQRKPHFGQNLDL
jgi:hypothetical protein